MCVRACMSVCVCLYTCMNKRTTLSVVPQVLSTFIYFIYHYFLRLYFYFVWIGVLPTCRSIHAVFLEARRGYQVSLGLGLQVIESGHGGEGIKPGTPGRTASSLNHPAIFPIQKVCFGG